MSDNLSNALIEAINDEYKARATYQAVIAKFGKIRPFVNIAEAEGRHIDALLPLFAKYNIVVPDDDWDSRIEIPKSVLGACHLGIESEIENAEMYVRLLDSTVDFPDVQAVLKQLQRASKENHLPAFQRCVQRGGTQGDGRGQHRRHGQGFKQGY